MCEWSSDDVTAHVDALWEAINMKARSSAHPLDLIDAKVLAEAGYLFRSMTVLANNTIVKE